MKYLFLPYEKNNTEYPYYTRKLLIEYIKPHLYPSVWLATWLPGQPWYYRGFEYTQPDDPLKAIVCASKEDGMQKLDEALIKNGHEFISQKRAQKLKLLL